MANIGTTDGTLTAFDPNNTAEGRPQATPPTSISVAEFEQSYAGVPPWDIDGPQSAVVRVTEAGLVSGRVLDIGCGTGENALYLAAQGREVVGLDGSPTAIGKAQAKARARGLLARFIAGDALRLTNLVERCDTVIDSGLLHVLSDEDRATLVAQVHAVLATGGRYHVLCFNQHASLPGPRRLTEDDIRDTFARGWQVESITPAQSDIVEGDGFTSDQAACWLATLRRL